MRMLVALGAIGAASEANYQRMRSGEVRVEIDGTGDSGGLRVSKPHFGNPPGLRCGEA